MRWTGIPNLITTDLAHASNCAVVNQIRLAFFGLGRHVRNLENSLIYLNI